MNFEQYSPLALRTCKLLARELQIKHAQIGMVTELGELADNFKKHFIYEKNLDEVNIGEECADMCWYFALYCDQHMIHPGAVDGWLRDAPDPFQGVTDLDLILTLSGLVGAACIVPENGLKAEDVCQPLIVGINTLLTRYDHTLSGAMERNIAKLALRYKDKFTNYEAINRDHAAERIILEG